MRCETNKPSGDIAPDCRHYCGDRPCLHNRLCRGCEHYSPYAYRVCIIKLGALGDVIRTLCILPELQERYPDLHITWVTLPNGCRLLDGHPSIQRVLRFDALSILALQAEAFDTVISLDKESQPCALAMSLRAKRKLGIGLSRFGTPIPLNAEAEPYFKLGLSNDLKFRQNLKSYPRLVYEALGWRYRGQRYELPLEETLRETVQSRLIKRGWRRDQITIGINVGAGRAFANKMWPAPRMVDVIVGLRVQMPEAQVLLLGGPDERGLIDQIIALLALRGISTGVTDAGADHSEQEFVAAVDACDVLFCGDTMAMHVALARGRGVAAFFGPTCEQEIDLFGLGEKLVADVSCGPCYKRVCDQADQCVSVIPAQEAVRAIARVLNRVRGAERSFALPVMRRAG